MRRSRLDAVGLVLAVTLLLWAAVLVGGYVWLVSWLLDAETAALGTIS